MSDQWLDEYVRTLRTLRTPTAHQRALLILFDNPARTIDEERKLAALIKAERATVRAQRARANATRALETDRLSAIRERDHLAIVRGALFDYALLENRDPGELLGALLSFIEEGAASDRQSWKQEGDALIARQLARSTSTRQTRARAPAASSTGTVENGL